MYAQVSNQKRWAEMPTAFSSHSHPKIWGAINKEKSLGIHANSKASGGGCEIRTHAPVKANGFQDRLVVTASIFLHITATHRAAVICREYLHGSEKFIFQNPLRIPHEVIGELAHQWRVWVFSSTTRYSVTAFLDCNLLFNCDFGKG